MLNTAEIGNKIYNYTVKLFKEYDSKSYGGYLKKMLHNLINIQKEGLKACETYYKMTELLLDSAHQNILDRLCNTGAKLGEFVDRNVMYFFDNITRSDPKQANNYKALASPILTLVKEPSAPPEELVPVGPPPSYDEAISDNYLHCVPKLGSKSHLFSAVEPSAPPKELAPTAPVELPPSYDATISDNYLHCAPKPGFKSHLFSAVEPSAPPEELVSSVPVGPPPSYDAIISDNDLHCASKPGSKSHLFSTVEPLAPPEELVSSVPVGPPPSYDATISDNYLHCAPKPGSKSHLFSAVEPSAPPEEVAPTAPVGPPPSYDEAIVLKLPSAPPLFSLAAAMTRQDIAPIYEVSFPKLRLSPIASQKRDDVYDIASNAQNVTMFSTELAGFDLIICEN